MINFVKPLCAAAVFTALAVVNTATFAEKADKDKPMNAQADALKYDDLNQTSVFTGNVIVTKGTILMRGVRIDVRQDAEGFQYAVITSAPGKLAYFKQKRENGVDEWIEGEAITIEYDGRADKVKLIKNSILKRLRGAAVNDEITGDLIVYDNTTDVYNVDGGNGAKNADGTGGGRVRAILSPKAASANSKPVTSQPAAPTISSTLRSSTSLSNNNAGNNAGNTGNAAITGNAANTGAK